MSVHKSLLMFTFQLVCVCVWLLWCAGPQGAPGAQGEMGDDGEDGLDGATGEVTNVYTHRSIYIVLRLGCRFQG